MRGVGGSMVSREALSRAKGHTHRWTHKQRRTHTHTQEWQQQIASKVIDGTLWDVTAPVQLQSLLSLAEFSHGQSELEPRRNLLETRGVTPLSVSAKQPRRPQNSLPVVSD